MRNGKFRRIYWNGIVYIQVRDGGLVVAVQGSKPKIATCVAIWDSKGNVFGR